MLIEIRNIEVQVVIIELMDPTIQLVFILEFPSISAKLNSLKHQQGNQDNKKIN